MKDSRGDIFLGLMVIGILMMVVGLSLASSRGGIGPEDRALRASIEIERRAPSLALQSIAIAHSDFRSRAGN